MADLRTKFIEAKLAGTKLIGDQGYTFRSNEGAADQAVYVVKQWLIEQANKIQYSSGDFTLKRLVESLDKEIWVAPWTEEQALAIWKYQWNPNVHPYTCGNDSDHPKLVPSERGFHCARCDYTQRWSHVHEG